MEIKGLGQDASVINAALSEAKKGRCCSFRRVYVVRVDGKVHRVSMNIFERIWAAFVKIFGIDTIKRKLEGKSITYIHQMLPVSTKDLDPPRKPDSVDLDARLEKILSMAASSLNVKVDEVKELACRVETLIPEVGENVARPPLVLTPKELQKVENEEIPHKRLKAACFYLLMQDKIAWFHDTLPTFEETGRPNLFAASQSFTLGFNEEPENLGPESRLVNRESLAALEARFIDVKALNHDSTVVDTELLEAAVKKINRLSGDMYALKRFYGISCCDQKGEKADAVLNFLVEKGVIHSWSKDDKDGRRFLFRETDDKGIYASSPWYDLASIQQAKSAV